MRSSWPEVRVGDLVSRGALGISDGYRVRNEELGPEGIPFVRGGDIGDGWINHRTVDHIRPEFSDRVKSKMARPGDVAFITKGTVGRAGFLKSGQPPVVFAPQVAYWRAIDQDQLDPRFLFYLVRSREFQIALDAVKSHGAMVADYVSISQQLDFRFRFPDISAQRQIGRVLGALDDKIHLNRRMAETLESIARAIFKSWFVDFDPVRAKAEGRETGLAREIAQLFPDRLVESEIGLVPEGWAVKGLDQFARFLNGLALQKFPPVGDAKLPVIKIAQLRAGSTAGADYASADLPQEYVVKDGDLLFSWSGSLECALWAGGQGALNQHLFKVTPLGGYPRWLCYLSIQLHLSAFRRIAASKATTMGHIQRHHLSEAKLAVPPPEVLDAADDVLGPLVESTWKRALESRTLVAVRDALLPKLISGEVSVPPRDPREQIA